MVSYQELLRNEFGTPIIIDVQHYPRTASLTGYVKIIIQGPDSTMENTLTELETESLRKILNKFSL